MAFCFSEVRGSAFTDFRGLCDYAAREKQALQRFPLADALRDGAVFYDDHSFGGRGNGFQFNEEGLRAFCRLLKVPFGVATTIEKEGLATELLNDVLGRAVTRAELNDHDLVTDTCTNLIVGVVSRSYVTYSNHDLLTDLKRLVERQGNGSGPGLAFETGFVLNTTARVRFRSKFEKGLLRSKDRTSKDTTVIGFQFVNSMIGDIAVRIEFYLHRLVCANGLIVPVSHTENVVFHSGKERNFLTRLEQRFEAVLRGIENVKKLWQDLADLDFEPHALAKAGFTSEILDIFPEYRERLRQEGSELQLPPEMSKEEKRLEREATTLNAIPKHLASGDSARVFRSYWRENKTLFDFVNLFTEKAKECEDIGRRIQIEEKTGQLADRLVKHKKKLSAARKRYNELTGFPN